MSRCGCKHCILRGLSSSAAVQKATKRMQDERAVGKIGGQRKDVRSGTSSAGVAIVRRHVSSVSAVWKPLPTPVMRHPATSASWLWRLDLAVSSWKTRAMLALCRLARERCRRSFGAGSTGWLEREAAGKSERTSGHLGSRDVRSHKNECLVVLSTTFKRLLSCVSNDAFPCACCFSPWTRA